MKTIIMHFYDLCKIPILRPDLGDLLPKSGQNADFYFQNLIS